LPSWDLFERQEAAYRESVLPNDVRARVAVEAGLARGWERYVGLDGAVVGLDDFGASAPYTTLYAQFGIAADAVIARAKELLAKGGRKRAAKERL
jgi:transketolase